MTTRTPAIPLVSWPLSSIVTYAERNGWGALEGRQGASVRALLRHHANIGLRMRGADVSATFTGSLWRWAEAIGWRCRKTASRAVYRARAMRLVRKYTPGTIAHGEPTRTVLSWSKAALISLLVAGREATEERRAQARADHAARVSSLKDDHVIWQRLKAAPGRIFAGQSMGTWSPPSVPTGEDSYRASPLTEYAEPSIPAPTEQLTQARAAAKAAKAKRLHRAGRQ